MFSAIGLAVQVDDDQMDAVTALAGSGPAFVYAMIEALARGGEKMGLTKQSALRLAAQTALGASDLMITSEKSPADLIKMVVTPGGTTAAGLRVMDERGIADAIADAIRQQPNAARKWRKRIVNPTTSSRAQSRDPVALPLSFHGGIPRLRSG